MIPTFRNEIEAAMYAERAKPLESALKFCDDEAYARKYGLRARNAVNAGTLAALKGDMDRMALHARSLSTILFHERPDLFETRERMQRMAYSFSAKQIADGIARPPGCEKS